MQITLRAQEITSNGQLRDAIPRRAGEKNPKKIKKRKPLISLSTDVIFSPNPRGS